MTVILSPAQQAANVEQAAGGAQAIKARALHLINGEHYSGAERVQDLLGLRLVDHGYEVGYVCLKPDRFPALRRAQRSPLWEMPMRSRLDLRLVGSLARLIRREQFALLHAHTPRSALIGRMAAAWARVPLVYHVHSPTARDSTRSWQNRCNVLAERMATSGRVHLIAVSQSLGEHMRSAGYQEQRLTVVPNGVPAPQVTRIARAPENTWTLGTVALFRPRKGLEILIEALAQLSGEGLPIRLRAVGGFETPEYEQQMLALADRLAVADRIDWTGFTQDVASELARMDLFILPSLFGEGLPMVVLEAMAAGVPTVATAVEGVPEAIRDGLDGLLAEPGDAQSLAACTSRVVRGEVSWQQLRDSAMQRHRDAFSDRAMAAGVAAVYDRLLDRR